jgi:hypothetical protein
MLPIAGNAFPEKDLQKKSLVSIGQKPPHLLSKLLNKTQRLLQITMNYTFCLPSLTTY